MFGGQTVHQRHCVIQRSHQNDGAEIGTIEAVQGDTVLLAVDDMKAPVPANAFGTTEDNHARLVDAYQYQPGAAAKLLDAGPASGLIKPARFDSGGGGLIGGIAACFMIPAPAWFMALDLLVAYLPMAWLAIRLGKKICYAQWEDVGPFETDDWGYVFGRNPQPKTVMNNGVGLDVSPAVRDYLGLVSGVRCDWRFCEVSEVPDGPWRKFGENNPFVTMKDRQWAERIKRLAELERERAAWLKQSRTTVMGSEPLDGRGG